MKNWKTTISGIIMLGIGVATKMDWITADIATAIILLAGSLGLIVASDGKKEE